MISTQPMDERIAEIDGDEGMGAIYQRAVPELNGGRCDETRVSRACLGSRAASCYSHAWRTSITCPNGHHRGSDSSRVLVPGTAPCARRRNLFELPPALS